MPVIPNLVGKTASEAKAIVDGTTFTRGPGTQTGNVQGNHLITAQTPAAGSDQPDGTAISPKFDETHAYYLANTVVVWGN